MNDISAIDGAAGAPADGAPDMSGVADVSGVAAPKTLSSAPRTVLYLFLVLLGVILAAYYRLRTDSLFGCQAAGYSADRFLAYCQTDGYGDFDHGAFWFKLEPEAARAAAASQVLFLGNSRLQYGFSTAATHEWFAQNSRSYYLLGLAYGAQVVFHQALLQRLGAHPRVYIINLDAFFGSHLSGPADMVMHDPGALSHYRTKRFWQTLHRAVCGRVAALCGNSYAIFRNRGSGVWQPSGAISANEAISYLPKADEAEAAREAVAARKFLTTLGVDPRCVIFTLVPTVDTPQLTSAAIAAAVKVDFVAPQIDDLLTFDGSHLDRMSAERWSDQFFDAAGPKIRQCLGH